MNSKRLLRPLGATEQSAAGTNLATLICTTRRSILASARTNQGPEKTRVGPALRGGGWRLQCTVRHHKFNEDFLPSPPSFKLNPWPRKGVGLAALRESSVTFSSNVKSHELTFCGEQIGALAEASLPEDGPPPVRLFGSFGMPQPPHPKP